MPQLSAEKSWFALTVRPRAEVASAAALEAKGYEPFVPVYRTPRRWSDRIQAVEVPLFSGYVFCRFNPEDRFPVLTTPGVSSIVSVGRTPASISESEIGALQSISRSGVLAEPWPFLKVGRKVCIGSGPLKGMEGILVQFKKKRLVVSVSLLQRSVAVELDRDEVRPA